jgi:hypothetical protein
MHAVTSFTLNPSQEVHLHSCHLPPSVTAMDHCPSPAEVHSAILLHAITTTPPALLRPKLLTQSAAVTSHEQH